MKGGDGMEEILRLQAETSTEDELLCGQITFSSRGSICN
jgi:hypothetical protein